MRIGYLVCGVVLAGWLCGCKSAGEPCQREMTACLKRCEAMGGDLNPLPTTTPQNTLTPCETRCQNCRSTPSPAPSGPPTPTGTAQPQASAEPHVLAVALEPAISAQAGAAHELTLRLRIADGYHVMSNAPSEPQFIATRLSLAAMPDVSWQPARFPPAHMFRVSDHEIATFVGEVSVTVPFLVASSAASGPREISGSVAYQACTDASCLFPTTERFASRLEIAR